MENVNGWKVIKKLKCYFFVMCHLVESRCLSIEPVSYFTSLV